MSEQLTFDEEQARAIEMLYMTENALARRRRAIELAAIGPGGVFLDLGCGPGFLSLEAAEVVGQDGQVYALDSSDSMLGMARARAENAGVVERVEFHLADATKLPFPDETFDAAAVVQVYEYVGDMVAALAELRRVLKPGGRFVIVDTDWGTNVLHSSDEQRTQKIFKAFEGHLAHVSLPRSLAPMLRNANLELSSIEPIVQLSTGQADAFAKALVKIVRDYVIGKDGLTEAQVDEWVKGLEFLMSSDQYFWSLTQFFFVGKRAQ